MEKNENQMLQHAKKVMLRIDYNAPVVLTFAILSFAALLLGYLTNGWSTFSLFSVYRSVPSIFSGVRLFGHVFGHAGIEHYSANIMLMLLLGPMLEEKYGSLKLALMMVAVALVTGLTNIILFPNTMLLGASGIVFMMMVLSSVTGMKKGKIPLTLIIVIVIYIGQEIVLGLTSTDNISRLTHIIGGVLGAVFGLAFNRNEAGEEEL